jgi:hypothetical protein
MKVVTTVKNGWLAQSNSAQLNWPSFEASRGVSVMVGNQISSIDTCRPRAAIGTETPMTITGDRVRREEPGRERRTV